jgi:signal transduction histidine kinase
LIPEREENLAKITDTTASTPCPAQGDTQLDTKAFINASKVLMGEIVLDDLLLKMVRIMIENAGAQRGLLLFREEGLWFIKAQGVRDKDEASLTHTRATSQDVPLTIIEAVARTHTAIVLNDPGPEGPFQTDPYLLRYSPKSILCAPIVYQGLISCIVYLENALTSCAFPPIRQKLIWLLNSQAAISIRNSNLYAKFASTVSQLHDEIKRRKETQLQLLHAEKLSALGRLSASIAHEFGNPLIGVRYLIEDIRKRPTLSKEDQDLLEIGLEECDRMKLLISDLQQLNRPSSGKRRRFNIHHAIDNVFLFQKKNLKAKKIAIIKAYDYNLPEIVAVEDQITQVLVNLTINAVDATPAEGGSVTVSTSGNQDTISISIKDTGTGIRPEHQDHIFEPFFSTKTQAEGTGLGLSVSYGIIAGHGGTITFSSQPGQGSIFTVTLPVTLPDDPP